MLIQREALSVHAKVVRAATEVKRCVASVNCRVVVRTDEHHIFECVVAATTEPLDVMRVAKVFVVFIARVPRADLAFARVHLLQAVGELPIARRGRLVEIFLSFFGHAGLFLFDEVVDDFSAFVQKQRGFESFFRKKVRSRLQRQVLRERGEDLMILLRDVADGCFTLKRLAQVAGFRLQ